MLPRVLFITALLLVTASSAHAQTGYEFEVYSPELGTIGSTEIELSSNYVADGLRIPGEGLYSAHHALRSSLEINRTLARWLQASLYLTSNARPGHGLAYVGNRLKVTTVAPSSWKLPVELGLANEISYARAGFSENRWMYELTPILAKSFGPVSLVLNPAFERGLSGSGEHHIEMEPRGKIAYGFGDDASLGLEYYAGLGGIGESYTVGQQRHQVVAKFETEVARQFEFGIGLGRGLTRSSDRWVITSAFEYKLGR